MEGFWKKIDGPISEVSIDQLHRFGVPDLVVKRLISFESESVRVSKHTILNTADCLTEEKRWHP